MNKKIIDPLIFLAVSVSLGAFIAGVIHRQLGLSPILSVIVIGLVILSGFTAKYFVKNKKREHKKE